MRFIILGVVVIMSIGTIIAGHIHWKDKLATYHGAKSSVVAEVESKTESETSSSLPVDVSLYTKNLPEEVQQKFQDAAESNTPVVFTIMGSKSTSASETAWPSLLKQQLTETYGEVILKINIIEIPDKNSTSIIEEELYKEAVSQKPDLVLLEPFMLQDNGEVTMEDRLKNLEFLLNEFRTSNPEAYIFLQPANPLYQATYYPREIQDLAGYATENNITYLNHWEAWPDLESSELTNYLLQDPNNSLKSIPNEAGHKLWADYLIQYFISE
ncbi:acyl-CoA hydrolase [Bacillus mesophilus]|uniref:SGNH/GDSL hydrolase family protein n=1 Tax=Bacillus mesophilus TaxID=1808955 RepID=A0A6M0Q801_9BACI|nr:SGNH/GDSL hydrolase family protein [Bacillus mesophilus]MBM7661738.1 acyl-CoA hydrolase [Bacillus mesophilus]NEY72397.1 SGNH/GDSL hydrolase family protein [Bacillus mesophilus]